jgi:hypothetical protein
MFIYLMIYKKKNQNWLNLPSLWTVTTLTTSQNWPKKKKNHVGGRSFTIMCKVTQKEYKKPNDIHIKSGSYLWTSLKWVFAFTMPHASILIVQKLWKNWVEYVWATIALVWLSFLTRNHWTRNDQKANNFTYLQSQPKYKTIMFSFNISIERRSKEVSKKSCRNFYFKSIFLALFS